MYAFGLKWEVQAKSWVGQNDRTISLGEWGDSRNHARRCFFPGRDDGEAMARRWQMVLVVDMGVGLGLC